MKLRLDVTNFENAAFVCREGQADVDVDDIVRAMQAMGPGDLADFVQAIEDAAADIKAADVDDSPAPRRAGPPAGFIEVRLEGGEDIWDSQIVLDGSDDLIAEYGNDIQKVLVDNPGMLSQIILVDRWLLQPECGVFGAPLMIADRGSLKVGRELESALAAEAAVADAESLSLTAYEARRLGDKRKLVEDGIMPVAEARALVAQMDKQSAQLRSWGVVD